MAVSAAQFSILVREYDEAIAFFTEKVGLPLISDARLDADTRWVALGAPGGARVILARASTADQLARIGNQTGGRVGFFLQSDDFDADHARMSAAGVVFVRPVRAERYGKVAVFEDLYGNLWDLIG